MIVRAGDFPQELRRIDDAEVVGPERADPDDAEVLIANHDRVRRPPRVAGEQACRQVIDVCLERRFEAVLPAPEPGQNRDVVRRQAVLTGTEQVAVLAKIDELHGL